MPQRAIRADNNRRVTPPVGDGLHRCYRSCKRQPLHTCNLHTTPLLFSTWGHRPFQLFAVFRQSPAVAPMRLPRSRHNTYIYNHVSLSFTRNHPKQPRIHYIHYNLATQEPTPRFLAYSMLRYYYNTNTEQQNISDRGHSTDGRRSQSPRPKNQQSLLPSAGALVHSPCRRSLATASLPA